MNLSSWMYPHSGITLHNVGSTRPRCLYFSAEGIIIIYDAAFICFTIFYRTGLLESSYRDNSLVFRSSESTYTSSIPMFIPLPPMGEWTWAASPAKKMFPSRSLFEIRWLSLNSLLQICVELVKSRSLGRVCSKLGLLEKTLTSLPPMGIVKLMWGVSD